MVDYRSIFDLEISRGRMGYDGMKDSSFLDRPRSLCEVHFKSKKESRTLKTQNPDLTRGLTLPHSTPPKKRNFFHQFFSQVLDAVVKLSARVIQDPQVQETLSEVLTASSHEVGDYYTPFSGHHLVTNYTPDGHRSSALLVYPHRQVQHKLSWGVEGYLI